MSIDYFVHNEAAIYKAVVIRGRDYFSINTLTDICTCVFTKACFVLNKHIVNNIVKLSVSINEEYTV